MVARDSLVATSSSVKSTHTSHVTTFVSIVSDSTLLRSTLDQTPTQMGSLTARELEVLRYLADDYSNQQIADLLVIEVRTVKHHVHNILAKLNVGHRWDAARLALEQGWLSNE